MYFESSPQNKSRSRFPSENAEKVNPEKWNPGLLARDPQKNMIQCDHSFVFENFSLFGRGHPAFFSSKNARDYPSE
jgi:hypothetical protein